ncbi:hypothetical protein REH65_25450 [Saccharopolyspora sp. ID03-671]|uniref:hypothetical protein n=1 Tax=Saccharopolyspora sp. ID03-671 TaxID=3073066 RepID=UPI003243999B
MACRLSPRQLRDVLVALGYDVDVPWRKLRKKDRDWILYTEETPSSPSITPRAPR